MNNSILFEVKFLGPTNFRGARVKITNRDLNNQTGVSKTLGFDHSSKSSHEQVIEKLQASGFKVIALNTRYKPNVDLIMCEWDWEKLLKFFAKKGK